MRSGTATALALLVCALGACGRAQTLEPPVLHYGQDLCAHCGMIVSEERFAAAAIVEDGDGRYEARVYDDIGCMVAAGQPVPGRIVARYVHDHDTLEWTAADAAVYVRSATLATPMLSGLAAWEDRKRAETGAARYDGSLLGFSELTPGLDSPRDPAAPR